MLLVAVRPLISCLALPSLLPPNCFLHVCLCLVISQVFKSRCSSKIIFTNLQGVVGTPPSPKDVTAALQAHAMYVYFGHGSGEQYLPLAALRRLPRCAANLLMGCSSGRLRLHGGYDPAGAVWSLLLAGEWVRDQERACT